jgi:hypothetical protein
VDDVIVEARDVAVGIVSKEIGDNVDVQSGLQAYTSP